MPYESPEVAQSNAKQEQQRAAAAMQIQQDALAVNESDLRVQPHLAQLKADVTMDAEAQARNKVAFDAAQTQVNESRAVVEAAVQQLAEAGAHLAAARADYQTKADALAKLSVPSAVIVPAQHLRPGEGTGLMFFPRAVTINTDDRQATFPAGIHPVPESLQAHWWIVANGVRPYKGTVPQAAAAPDLTQQQEPSTHDNSGANAVGAAPADWQPPLRSNVE
jgi:hypothetical protein